MRYLTLLIFSFCINIYPQQFTISGIVKDKSTGTVLEFANIRVLDSYTGTAANRKGIYEIKLKPGSYSLAASYIGYYSDTINVDLYNNTEGVDFFLSPAKIELQEITVTPGENPAVGVIKKAIERKNIRNAIINSYEHEAYTKGIIKTDQEISTKGAGVNLSLGDSDSSNLFITGIIENQSRGYFKKPDKYKEIITARKQSANLPSSINILTGGRVIQNFYDEEIDFLGGPLKGPLADDALNYYYYYIEEMTAVNDLPVYKIHMTPDNSVDPGFDGYIYITDSTYDLIKTDLQLNRSANVGGLFDSINVYQQFNKYDGIFMPADYRLYASANILNLVKFAFELNTILYDYKINNKSEEVFNKAVVTVVPEADERDSLFWGNIQTIPNTDEESSAYKRIDSINNIPFSFWDEFSILSTRVNLNENFSVTGPLSLYHFNSVEGHSLNFGFYADNLYKERLSSSLLFGYGFADKKLKTDFSIQYLFNKYRTGKIELDAWNKTRVLFYESDDYNDLTATLLSLLSKYEFRDYYYSRGIGINISEDVFPVLRLNIGYNFTEDRSAEKRTEFSFFAKNKKYKDNKEITRSILNILSAGFTIDFRNYIEDGLYRNRISEGKSFIILKGGIKFSDNDILHSSHNFTQYNITLEGFIRSFRSAYLSYDLKGIYTKGNLPLQMFYSLPGNIDLTAVNNSFRTLELNEVIGDRIFTANIEYNLRDEIFKALRIPWLKTSELQLKLFMNSAVSYISGNSAEIQGYTVKEFHHPFYEAGFSIGHVLFPMDFSFSWKLNYRDGNNFRFGICTFIY